MSLSRREMLTLLLGAPLGAEACRRRPPGAIPGQVQGAAISVGHRLRETTVEHASGPAERVGVAIVGSGPSGLSAAWRLERLGARDYRVFDLEPRAGGTSTYGTDGVVPHPWGAHYVPAPLDNPALETLFDEMGVYERGPGRGERRIRERLLVRDPEERLFIGGAWRQGLYPLYGASRADLRELQRFQRQVDQWVAFRDARGRRAFTIPASRCSDDAEVTALDRISAARWVRDQGFRSRRLHWYLNYACRDDYGLTLETASAWALLFYFAARVPAPRQDSAPFVTWPEGNGRLVEHLMSAVGPRVRIGNLVTDVVPKQDTVELSVLDVEQNTLRRYLADYVILAIPKFIVPRILKPWRDHPPPHLGDFRYGVWMVANLHLSRRPKSDGFPFAWDNVLYDSPGLGYVVATHQRLIDHGPTIWTYYRPFVDADPDRARDKLAAIDHTGACDAILGDLRRAHHDLDETIERIDVYRWGHAMIGPRTGFIWGPARRAAAKPLGRIHFAHSDLSGLALFEEAQQHGIRAAEEVLRARGHRFEPLAG